VAEGVIRRRFVRRLAGVVPGTRIGRVRWPPPLPARPWPWHYWWQAHLLDCLVDAQRRAPHPVRARQIAALARTVRLRNLGSWTNDYDDDIAWFGLAVHRAGPLARRSAQPALTAIGARLRAGCQHWASRRSWRCGRRCSRWRPPIHNSSSPQLVEADLVHLAARARAQHSQIEAIRLAAARRSFTLPS
jgi:predicted alpha-1,6-mannanase (GH76 family)